MTVELLVVYICIVYRGGSGVHGLEDVLPLSSQFLMSSGGGGHQKRDAATLAAENHTLHDTLQQQRFKLKV